MLKKLESRIKELMKKLNEVPQNFQEISHNLTPSLKRRFENLYDYVSQYPEGKVNLTEKAVIQLYHHMESDKSKFELKESLNANNPAFHGSNYGSYQRVLERLDTKYGVALFRLIEEIFNKEMTGTDMAGISQFSDYGKNYLMLLMRCHKEIDQTLDIDSGRYPRSGFKYLSYVSQSGPLLIYLESVKANGIRDRRDVFITMHSLEFSGINPTYQIKFDRLS